MRIDPFWNLTLSRETTRGAAHEHFGEFYFKRQEIKTIPNRNAYPEIPPKTKKYILEKKPTGKISPFETDHDRNRFLGTDPAGKTQPEPNIKPEKNIQKEMGPIAKASWTLSSGKYFS